MTLQQRYDAAIETARAGHMRSLPLSAIPGYGSKVRVVSWTPDRKDVGPVIDPAGSRRVNGDFWVTLESEMQARCKSFSQQERIDLPLRTKQLLGLPPYFRDGKAGGFAVMEVDVTTEHNLFRPCMNPDPTQSTCAAPTPPLPSNPKIGHEDWMVKTAQFSYVTDHFPWTQLGYTFDWANPERPYGVSEYIVKDGSTVKQFEWQPIEQFCAAPS